VLDRWAGKVHRGALSPVCMYVCVCMCVFVCMCVYVCMYVCMCVYECICVRVRMCVCAHVCVHLCAWEEQDMNVLSFTRDSVACKRKHILRHRSSSLRSDYCKCGLVWESFIAGILNDRLQHDNQMSVVIYQLPSKVGCSLCMNQRGRFALLQFEVSCSLCMNQSGRFALLQFKVSCSLC